MSDRIVVYESWQFEQIGTPDEIYNHPKTSYGNLCGKCQYFKRKSCRNKWFLYAQVQIGNDTVSVYTEEIVKVGEQLSPWL